MRPRGGVHLFEGSYRAGTPPWDVGHPQPAFVGAADGFRGRVLDAGCGTGEHALLAAGRGLDATGIDTSETAIERARAKAEERGLRARFLVWDALDLASLGDRFETVLDCGLFHVFDDDDRARYVASLGSAVDPGGLLHVLCFSDLVPPGFGPRRVSQEEIRESFADGWIVRSIDAARMDVTFAPPGIPGWFATIERAGDPVGYA
jgi:SAM-dependent methyltransferase